jgi:hypothetical protein
MLRIAGLLCLAVVTTGCATSYVTPGGPARLNEINRYDVAEVASRQPTVKLPGRLAIVRIQAPDYRSYSTEPFVARPGNFSAVTNQDLLTDGDVFAIEQWPEVAAVVPVTSLTLPARLDTIDDLRVSGARVQADILLVYTIDTTFRVQGKGYGPLAVITLGLAPDRDAYVTSTASAVLIDVRSGYVYGVAEATAKESGLTSAWESRHTVDRKRIKAERASLDLLLQQVGKTWAGVVKKYH